MMNVKYIFEKLLVIAGVFYYYTSTLFPNNIQQVLMYTAVVGMVLAGLIIVRHLLVNNISKKTLIFITAFLIILTISYLLNWSNIVWLALMSVPMLSVDRDSYIKTIFYASFCLFALTVSLSILGILPLEYINFAGEVEERYGSVKYSLGFDGPNQAAFAFFAVLLSGLYTYGTNKFFVIFISLATLAVGITTGSRTGFTCSVLFIVFYLYNMRNANREKEEKVSRILPYLFIALAALSIFVVTVFKDDANLNDLLSNRIEAVNYYLHSDYIPTLLGSDQVYNKAQYQTPPLDNFPTYVLGRYGLVGFFLVALLLYASMRRETSYRIKTVFLFIMLYGMTEAFFDISAKNFLLPIFLHAQLTRDKKKETT